MHNQNQNVRQPATNVDPRPRAANEPRHLEVVTKWQDTILDYATRELHTEHATVAVPFGSEFELWEGDGRFAQGQSSSESVVLRDGDRLAFSDGALTYIVRIVSTEAPIRATPSSDWLFARVFALSAMGHSFFVILSLLTPAGSRYGIDALTKNDPDFARAILVTRPARPVLEKVKLSGRNKSAYKKGKRGKFGKRNERRFDAQPSKPGTPRVAAEKRIQDREVVLNSGLLKILAESGGRTSQVMGPGGMGTGFNEALGGLKGSALSNARGFGGLSTRGTGSGGDGDSIEIGGLGTGDGNGGDGDIELGGGGKRKGDVLPGRTVIIGSLSKATIARVIRRNIPRIKHCYEKELNASPNLAGKIAVRFVIAPTGKVGKTKIVESTVGNRRVDTCVRRVIGTLRFPPPNGGGIVIVNYPFVFQSI